MVLEEIKDRTNQCFTNISRSRGSTIMFYLSKYFSQICLAIYGDKVDFFFSKQLKMVRERKKTEKSSTSFTYLLCKLKLN